MTMRFDRLIDVWPARMDLERVPGVDPGERPAQGAGTMVPVVMCRGLEIRLRPASRESIPKQFIPLLEYLSNCQIAALRFSDPAFSLFRGEGTRR